MALLENNRTFKVNQSKVLKTPINYKHSRTTIIRTEMQGETSKLEKRKKWNKKINMSGTQYLGKKKEEKKILQKKTQIKMVETCPNCVINKMQIT